MSSYSGFSSRCNYNWTGKILKKNYIMIKKLGFGSYAVVWLCYSLKHKKCFAIKILNPEDYISGQKEIDIFQKINKLKCKYILSMIEYFDIEVPNDQIENNKDKYYDDKYKHICIILELMYCSIYDIIKQCHKTGKYLPLNFIKNIIHQVLLATNVLHKNNIIHTDIKPENILVSLDNATEISKIIGLDNDLIIISNYFNKTDINSLILKLMKELTVKNKKKYNNNKLKQIAIYELVKKILLNLKPNQNLDQNINQNSNINDDDSIEYKSIDDYKIKRYEITDSESESELSDNEELLDCELLNKLKKISIKLSDLGTCIEKDKINYNTIQTRHYRAPEVILKLKYNEKCDIWSIGCCIYELLTLELLFNPDETNTISCDRFHICDFISKLGLIPKKMIRDSSKKDIFYKKNGFIRGLNDININPLFTDIEDIRIKIYNQDQKILLLFELMEKMLLFDLNKRSSAHECLQHILFK